jgi:hypothetical protein
MVNGTFLGEKSVTSDAVHGNNWTGWTIATQCLSRSLRRIIAGCIAQTANAPRRELSLTNHPGIP